MKLKLICLALLLNVTLSAAAWPAGMPSWGAHINEVQGGQIGRALSWPLKQKWRWRTNSEHAKVLESVVVLEAPFDLTAKNLHGEDEHTQIQVKGRRALVSGSRQTEIIHFGDSQDGFAIVLNQAKSNVIDDGCAVLRLNMESQSGPVPFFIGTHCETHEEEVFLHLTFPGDVELQQSSLFETAGKGENWHIYNLKRINAANSQLGRFDFRAKGSTYVYSLMSLRGISNEKQSHESIFGVALGYGMFSLAGEGVTASDSKPIVSAVLLPRSYWKNLGGGAEFTYALGLSSGPKSINYLQVEPYVHYRFQFGTNFELHPRLYYVIANEQHVESGVGFQSSQFGVGLHVQYRFSPQASMALTYMTASVASAVVKSHSLIEASYMKAMKKGAWGAGVKLQSYSVTGDAGTDKFSQTLLYGLYAF